MFLYGVQVTYVILPHVYFKLKKKKGKFRNGTSL